MQHVQFAFFNLDLRLILEHLHDESAVLHEIVKFGYGASQQVGVAPWHSSVSSHNP